MSERGRRVVIEPGTVDLEVEEYYDSKGNRIDDAYVERAVADVHEKLAAGRPSLTRPGAHSPAVSFRVPEDLRRRAEARAAKEGTTLSRLAREALERYLAS